MAADSAAAWCSDKLRKLFARWDHLSEDARRSTVNACAHCLERAVSRDGESALLREFLVEVQGCKLEVKARDPEEALRWALVALMAEGNWSQVERFGASVEGSGWMHRFEVSMVMCPKIRAMV